MRYVNCACNDGEQNLVVFQYRGGILYRCCRAINPGQELLVWYDEKYTRDLGSAFDSFWKKKCSANELPDALFQIYLNKHFEKCHYEKYMRLRKTEEIKSEPLKSSGINEGASCVPLGSDTSHREIQKDLHHCPDCGKSFTHPGNLQRHQLIHASEKPFRCSQCSKTLNRKHHLQQHQRIHSGFSSGNNLVMPAEVYGVRGTSVNFTATLDASTEDARVSWMFTSQTGSNFDIIAGSKLNPEVCECFLGRVEYYESSFTLQLNTITSEDNGIYTLIITISKVDEHGHMYKTTLEGRTSLVVLEPVREVSITSNLPEAVEYNSTVVFTCSAKGSFLSYTWLNNSAPVVVDGKHVVQNYNQLIISEVFRTDLRGPIYCTAKNQLESETSSAFNLAVNYGPDRITIKREPADDVLNSGSNVILSCSAQSVPAAEFTWLFNDVKLPQNSATVVLSNVGIQQSGNYSCIAYNSKTKRYATSELTTLTVIAGKRLSDRTIVTLVLAVLLLLEIIVVIFFSFKY